MKIVWSPIALQRVQLPEELMQTQTKRIIAEQQQEMYKMEQKSQAPAKMD